MTTLFGTEGNDTIGTVSEPIRMTASTSIVDALNGNDTITVANPYRNLTILAGNGNDSINLNSVLINSVVNGGNGNDTITVGATASVVNTDFNSFDGNNSWIFNSASTFNSVTGGLGNDTITFANAATSTDDVVLLALGNDSAVYGTGAVTRLDLGAGQGNDTITFAGVVTDSEIRGAKDNDSIVVTGTLIDSTLRGGGGNDTLRVDGLVTNSLLIDTLGTARFQFGTATSTATITGGVGLDTIALTVTGAVDTFFRNATAIDVLSLATTSASTITAGAFAQAAGINTIRNDSTSGNQFINATAFTAGITIVGGNTAAASSIEAGSGNDTIVAAVTAIADFVSGNNGNDLIDYRLSAGANTLLGDAGADTILGGTGDDVIDGGTGADLLTGGAGDDDFFFVAGDSFARTSVASNVATFGSGVDVITDFTANQNQLDVIIPALTPAVGQGAAPGLGLNASILANGTVQINPIGSAPFGLAGINNVYVAGTWDQTLGTFTGTTPGVTGADYMLFQVTLAQALVPNQALDITNQFSTAEAIILDNPTF